MSQPVTLMWCCKTPRGWLRFPALIKIEHGQRTTRHGWVKDRGVEVEYPEGHYQLRTYVDGRVRYQTLDQQHPVVATAILDSTNRKARAATGSQRTNMGVLKSAVAAYIRDREKAHKLEAAKNARQVLTEFMDICNDVQFVRLIDRDRVFKYHAALRKRGNGERTVANKHARLKSFLRFCKVDLSFLPDAPTYEEQLPTIYTPAETKAIRECADPYMRLVIEMALMLGLREQELAHACWTDVDWHGKVFRVQGKPELKFAVKDKEQREVPIPEELLVRLTEWRSAHPQATLILGTAANKPNTHLLRTLKRLAKRQGLNCGLCRGCKNEKLQECQRWTLHKFRRTYMTTLLRSNEFDLKTVQHYAGHSDIASTMRYLRPASAKETQSKINGIAW